MGKVFNSTPFSERYRKTIIIPVNEKKCNNCSGILDGFLKNGVRNWNKSKRKMHNVQSTIGTDNINKSVFILFGSGNKN